jgi:hypothetical protein
MKIRAVRHAHQPIRSTARRRATISAIYVAGITTAAATAPTCTVGLPVGKPLVAPVALPGGGGVAAALAF